MRQAVFLRRLLVILRVRTLSIARVTHFSGIENFNLSPEIGGI